MKAAVRSTYGPPEAVRVTDVPTPEPGPGELLVQVRATTVNRTDRGYRAGKPFIIRFFSGLIRPKFQVLGTEFAGTVEAVGDSVTSLVPGERVFGYNERSFGAHAQYMTIPEDGSVATIPTGLTFEQAAPSLEGSHYALAGLRAAEVGVGSDVLVYGARGAIGSVAVQLAKCLGGTVTAVCRGEHVALVESLGADCVIDYTAEDFTAHGATYDVVFDAVGKTSFARCKPLVRPRGLFLATDFGPFPWNPLLALTTRVGGGRRVLFPLPKDNQQVVSYLRDRIEAHEFQPVIDRTYALDDIVDAYRYVQRTEGRQRRDHDSLTEAGAQCFDGILGQGAWQSVPKPCAARPEFGSNLAATRPTNVDQATGQDADAIAAGSKPRSRASHVPANRAA